MTFWQIFSHWDFEPSVVIGCLVLGFGYLLWVQFKPRARSLAFFTGLGILAVALLSPLDGLGDTYLFSAHMVQHLLLLLIIAPLMILGLPEIPLRALLRRPFFNRLERSLSRPATALLTVVGVVWIWHYPPFYNFALAHESVHAIQHLTFLVSATIFWWPVITPLEEKRMPVPAVLLYIFLAGLADALLGIILTFVPVGLYPAYLHPEDPWHILTTIRNTWGITPQIDQQVGGLVMWVPGSLVYLIAILGCVLRWYNSPDPGNLVSTSESS
jgi:cytochrome c oxidase assembly factor CtaG